MDRVLCLPRRTMAVAAGKTQWAKLEPAMQKTIKIGQFMRSQYFKKVSTEVTHFLHMA